MTLEPLPAGALPLAGHLVTPEMSSWATAILRDSGTYPMGAVARATIAGLELAARVEVHTWWGADPSRPDEPHRGVSLYLVPEAG